MATDEELERQARDWLGVSDKPAANDPDALDSLLTSLGTSVEVSEDLRSELDSLKGLSNSALKQRQTEFMQDGNSSGSVVCQAIINARNEARTTTTAEPTLTDGEKQHFADQIERYEQLLKFEPEGSDNYVLYQNLVNDFKDRLGA